MKPLLKSLFRILALGLVSPLLLTHWLCSRCGGADPSLETHSQCLSCLPGTIGSFLRIAFYRCVLRSCDPSATIGFGVLFSKSDACVGRNVYIGPRCMLGLVTLEDDVLLGPGVQIPSGPQTHGIERLDVPIREQPGNLRRVTVGRDSWIGAASIVLADVAEQTVVGAGSLVTKPHPPRSILGGIPANVIRPRDLPSQS